MAIGCAFFISCSLLPGRDALTNVSVLLESDGNQNFSTLGFVVAGEAAAPVLIRAVGPSLNRLGVFSAPREQKLSLIRNSDGSLLAANQRWWDPEPDRLASASAQAGAFPLDSDSTDSALWHDVGAGDYSAVLDIASRENGHSLIEVYDGSPESRLSNVSILAPVGEQSGKLVIGFVVPSKRASQTILVRAVGPSLASFGIPADETSSNPEILIHDGQGKLIAYNDDWSSEAAIDKAFAAAGAFPLPVGTRDSAMLLTLPPGAYTAHAASGEGTRGKMLLELYVIDGYHPRMPEAQGSAPLWTSGVSVPSETNLRFLNGIRFSVIRPYQPAVDGFTFLHGVALAWHKGRLYSTFAQNGSYENSRGEQARWAVSDDAGMTWSGAASIDSALNASARATSHGVLKSRNGELWAFVPSFVSSLTDRLETRGYVLNEATGAWAYRGVMVPNAFFPMQEPQRIANGNWIMSGINVTGSTSSAAIAIGDADFGNWRQVVIPRNNLKMYGESSIVAFGRELWNIARFGDQAVALRAVSTDFGETWTASAPSNLPMASSKPYTGRLSTGQVYLIGTTTSNTGDRRSPLTIAVSHPGEQSLRTVFLIRRASFPDGPGESHPSAFLAYPYAVERDGFLYVGYSNNGGRGGNANSAELAVVPVAQLIP